MIKDLCDRKCKQIVHFIAALQTGEHYTGLNKKAQKIRGKGNLICAFRVQNPKVNKRCVIQDFFLFRKKILVVRKNKKFKKIQKKIQKYKNDKITTALLFTGKKRVTKYKIITLNFLKLLLKSRKPQRKM